MTLKFTIRLVAGLFALALAFGATNNASADSVADFYKGKDITLLIGYSPGGGFDTRARMLARHMSRHIPGNPTIVPQNMPGAGSKRLANYIYGVAPKDGTVFGVINEAMSMNTLFGVEGTEFDSVKFTWLGSLLSDPSICFSWRESGITSLDDVMTGEFIVGATGTGSTSYILPLTMINLLGAKVTPIPGYKGSKQVMLAIERGEVQGMCGMTWQSVNSVRPDWVKENKIAVLGQMGLERDPALPDVPFMLDMAKDADSKEALKLIFGNRAMGNPYVAPPGIPAERREALRRAFDATVRDPAFLADAEKLRMKIRPSTGEEIDALLAELYAAPERVVKLAIRATQPKP